jgi:hypothetical protein
MQDLEPKDELAGIRKFLKALESGTKIIRGGADVTAQEIHFLKLEIAYLEKVVAGTNDDNA